MKKYSISAGFTLIEVMIVVGIITVLFGFIGLNLSKVQQNTSLSAVVATITADIKSQQIKAMSGATEGRAGSDSYGIYVTGSSYIKFHGMTYIPSDTTNTAVTIASPISLSSTLPNGLLIFSKVSGEMAGYSQGQNTITITNTQDNRKKVITINQYGVIVSIQ